jgi:Domain of unknown function (DUF222)
MMCTADGSGCALAAPGGGFASVADALRVTRAAAAYLNSPPAADLDGPARGEALEQLAAITSLLGAAANGILRRFDADDGHDADGYATSAAWLAAKTHLGRKDAKAAVRHMRLLGKHPLLDAATTTGAVTVSWAREIAARTGRIDHDELQCQADQILVEAATAGADLDDLKLIAQAAYEAWRAQEPDPDEDPHGKGFGDRYLLLETTLDGAGRIRGDLTPECAAAVAAVLEALGKPRGPEDLRSAGQRYHDALQEGCELLIRAKMVPDRAGADTRVDVVIPLRDLLGMDGASVIEDTWLRARAGVHGYLAGKDAEAVACDALLVPVVTGSPDWAIISEMIALVTGAYGHARRAGQDDGQDGAGQPGRLAHPQAAGRPGPLPLAPEAWEALQYALARLAIRFVSGPGAIASALRRNLLGASLNTRSVPLDVGYRDTIPDTIRRAVILRDKHCAWAGGCDRRPAVSDVHHITHKKDGGPTSVNDCALLCNYHHDICVHRLGWKFELLPDGSTRATSPDGKTILRSHPPPPTTQPGS